MGNMWNQYPWSRPVPCDCGTGGSGGTGEGMSEQEVRNLVETYLARYVATTDLDARLVQYLKSTELSQYLSNYYTKQEINTLFSKTATINDITSRLGQHAELLGYGQLGHVNAVSRTPDMTQPVGIGADGGLWTKPGEGGSSCDLNPIQKTAEMTQPVGKDTNGKLWTKPGEGGGGGDNPFPSGRVVYMPVEGFTAAKLQQAVTDLESKGGGSIIFDAGQYNFETGVKINGAVNFYGQGIKNTVLKANTSMQPLIVKRGVYSATAGKWVTFSETLRVMLSFAEKARSYEVAHLTIDGTRVAEGQWLNPALTTFDGANIGILSEAVDVDNLDGYYYVNETSRVLSNPQGNKNAHIYDCFIMGCDCGIDLEYYSFGVHVTDCKLGYNVCGLCSQTSDNTYTNLEIFSNGVRGAWLHDGNCRINNWKVYWNGSMLAGDLSRITDMTSDHNKPYLAWNGSDPWADNYCLEFADRIMGSSIEMQDNFGKPWRIMGTGCAITGVLIDCCGYKDGGILNPATNWCNGVDIWGDRNNLQISVVNYLGLCQYSAPINIQSGSGNKVMLTVQDNASISKVPMMNGQPAPESAIKVL